MWIRLLRCTGWSSPLLFAFGINRFSHDVTPFYGAASIEYEPYHVKTNKVAFAPSEDSDQPGQMGICPVWSGSLLSAWRKLGSLAVSAQRRLWSDRADAQADLSLPWAQSFCWFYHEAARIMPHVPDMIIQPVTFSWLLAISHPISLRAKQEAASSIVNNFGMSRLGIKSATSDYPVWNILVCHGWGSNLLHLITQCETYWYVTAGDQICNIWLPSVEHIGMSRLGIKSATSDYPVWNILVCHSWGSNQLHLITQCGTYWYVTAGDQICYIWLPSVEHIGMSRLGIKSATSDYPVWNILVCHGWGSNLLHLITQCGAYWYVTAGDQICNIWLPSVEHIGMSRLGIKSATSDYPVWNILVCHGWGSNLLHLITQCGTYWYVTAGDQICYIWLPSVEHIGMSRLGIKYTNLPETVSHYFALCWRRSRHWLTYRRQPLITLPCVEGGVDTD